MRLGALHSRAYRIGKADSSISYAMHTTLAVRYVNGSVQEFTPDILAPSLSKRPHATY